MITFAVTIHHLNIQLKKLSLKMTNDHNKLLQ